MDSATHYKNKAYYRKALKWAELAYQKQSSTLELSQSADLLADVHNSLNNILTPLNYLSENARLQKNSRDKKIKSQYFMTLLDLATGYMTIKEFEKADSLVAVASANASAGWQKQEVQDVKTEIRMSRGQWEGLEEEPVYNMSLSVERDNHFGEYERIPEEIENKLNAYKGKGEAEYQKAYMYYFPAIQLMFSLKWDEYNYDSDLLQDVNSFFTSSEKIVIAVEGRNSFSYWNFLLGMADIFQERNENEKAILLCQQVYEESNKTLGNYNAFAVSALTTLAKLNSEMGNLLKAQKMFEEVQALARETLGEDSKAYMDMLRYYMDFEISLGRIKDARKHYEEILPVMIRETGKKSSDYSVMIYYNSELAKNNFDYEESARLVNEAISINEKNGVDCNPCFINLLISLAKVYEISGEWGKAEDTYMRAWGFLDNHSEDFKEEDYNLSMVRTMADFYAACKGLGVTAQLKYYPNDSLVVKDGKRIYVPRTGNRKAFTDWRIIQSYDENINYYLNKYGDKHSSIADFKIRKALFYWISGNQFRAGREFRESLDLSLEYMHLILPYLSEKEKTQFYQTIENRFGAYYAFGLTELNWISSIREEDMDYFRKEMGSDSVNYSIKRGLTKERMRMSGKDTIVDRSHFYEVQNRNNSSILNYRLATKGVIFNSSYSTKRRILSGGDSALLKTYNEWEAIRYKLSQLYASKMDEQDTRSSKIDTLEMQVNKLEREMAEKSQLLKNVQEEKSVTWKDIQKKLKPGEAAVEIIRYSYPIIQPGKDSVCYAALIFDYHTKDDPRVVRIKNGYDMENRGYNFYKNAIKYKLKDEQSYELFWKDIGMSIGGNTIVYFSPDGIYNLINLSALKTPYGQYLVEEKDIRIVTDLKDLLHGPIGASDSKNAFLLGDPDFLNTRQGDKKDSTDTERSVSITALLRGGIDELPGTKQETDRISSLLSANGWTTQTLQGQMASEKNLKSVSSPRLLHLATHGFFLKEQPGKAIENPLLRSGLLLSGASDKMNFDDDDGILTAYEAMNLNLDKTEMVVLSACETGLGEVSSGEGVYGLQRALRAAGAKGLIMSLWKVNDAVTGELMTLFYEEWLKTGDKRMAFRNAQLKIKSSYPDPYYWAAFILISSE